jgi:hypothetical protein
MTIRIPALAAFKLTPNEAHTPRRLSSLGAAIHSSRLVQTFCWILVLFL